MNQLISEYSQRALNKQHKHKNRGYSNPILTNFYLILEETKISNYQTSFKGLTQKAKILRINRNSTRL